MAVSFVDNKILSFKDIDSFFLFLAGPCYNDCLFCVRKTEPFSDISRLDWKTRDRGHSTKKICLVGNEPLIHPRITDIIQQARLRGFEGVEVMTSGELLADKAFLRCLRRSGLTGVAMPLYSVRAAVHDVIVGRRGSFKLAVRALRQARDAGLKVFVHSNLTVLNMRDLPLLESWVREELRVSFTVLPLRPKRRFMFQQLMPRYNTMVRALRGMKSLIGFPLCVLRCIQRPFFLDDRRISDSVKLYVRAPHFVKAAPCRRCRAASSCVGLFQEYLDRYGDAELRPFTAIPRGRRGAAPEKLCASRRSAEICPLLKRR